MMIPGPDSTKIERVRARHERSLAYGIEKLTFADPIPPEGLPTEEDFWGDPVNLFFPLEEVHQVKAALDAVVKQQKIYSMASLSVIHQRIMTRAREVGLL